MPIITDTGYSAVETTWLDKVTNEAHRELKLQVMCSAAVHTYASGRLKDGFHHEYMQIFACPCVCTGICIELATCNQMGIKIQVEITFWGWWKYYNNYKIRYVLPFGNRCWNWTSSTHTIKFASIKMFCAPTRVSFLRNVCIYEIECVVHRDYHYTDDSNNSKCKWQDEIDPSWRRGILRRQRILLVEYHLTRSTMYICVDRTNHRRISQTAARSRPYFDAKPSCYLQVDFR